MSTTTLREYSMSDATVNVDREKGIIKGVKIIGNESANGRTYPKAVLQKARGMYEGIAVNTDHPDRSGSKDRSVKDRLGKIANVREMADGLYGDLHVLKSHAIADQVFEAAERMPEMLGLSHNAEGRVRHDKGRAIVEEIIKVRSVDLVSDPATTKGLFESEQTMPATMRELIEALEKSAPADPWVKCLREMMDGGTMVSDMPVTDPGTMDGTTDEQVKRAFESMVLATFRDQMLDTKATLAKIKDILHAQERLMGSVKKPAERGTPALSGEPETPTEESNQTKPDPKFAELQEKVRLMEAEKDARKLLSIAKIEAKDELVETLALLPTTEHRKKLIESLPKGNGTPAPRSTSPSAKLTESKAPCDTNDLAKTAAFLRQR